MTSDPRRRVPRTDDLLEDPRLAAAIDMVGRERVKRAITGAQQRVRDDSLAPDRCADEALRVLAASPTGLRAVVNATGVVIHTNLGRAPLSEAALAAVREAAGYVDVEFDLESGTRARRGRSMLAELRRAVPDAADVHVVNNGAAALVLATTALARGQEIVVSRGELVEIGDGFRLPDLIESTGARLREVGTTNRVTLDDYSQAVGPQTAAVLKVHPSNFRIEGFTRSVPVADLARLPVPVVSDIGSGLLIPHPSLPDEPDVTSSLRAGAAVVTCSGDKLLGGPQAGLIFGRADAVETMRRHPLARAVRVDKLTIAALEATLAGHPSPVARYLDLDLDRLRVRCEELVDAVGGQVVAVDGVVGGGGAPGVRLAGWAVALPAGHAARLRRGSPPIVGRVDHDRCLLDLRCVPENLDGLVRDAILELALDEPDGS